MLSKHQIYLLEATEAVTATLESVKEYHDRITRGSSSEISIVRETRARFQHRGTLFKSTYLRLGSLEKRTQNMINLVCVLLPLKKNIAVTDLDFQSFNLVTQADSRIMKADSSSMKTIAAMTLAFLPCTAVAVRTACK